MTDRLCACGCGEPTAVATKTRRASGHVKGERMRFVLGHNRRGTTGAGRGAVASAVTTPCVLWDGRVNAAGYGRTTDGRSAHRAAYEAAHGPLPGHLHVDHLCRTRACVRVDHLQPVTAAENTRRGANTRLTAEDVGAIREDDRLQREIAADYGTTQSQVSKIKRHLTWR